MKNDFAAVVVGLIGALLLMNYIKKNSPSASTEHTKSYAMGVRG